MRAIKIAAATFILWLAVPFLALGHLHEKYEGWCHSLQNANSPELVQFLNAVVPDEWNARGVTWAVHKLSQERHEPAIPALVKLLDFRIPRPPVEGIFRSLSEETFPAEEALERIGKKALPEVLCAIETDATSAIARENALSVWMEIYRESDEQPKGVGLLKLEETRTKDGEVKQRLSWAVQKALTRCNPPEKSACEQAAKAGSLVPSP